MKVPSFFVFYLDFRTCHIIFENIAADGKLPLNLSAGFRAIPFQLVKVRADVMRLQGDWCFCLPGHVVFLILCKNFFCLFISL